MRIALPLFAAVLFAVETAAANAAPEVQRSSVTSDEAQVAEFSASPSVSADGRFVAFQSPGALAPGGSGISIFVRDRQAGTTSLVSGEGTRAAISADGRYVAFISSAALVGDDSNGLYDVYLRDLLLGTTTRINVNSKEQQALGGNSIGRISVSADGRFVAFASDATNLVPRDTNTVRDVFVRDQQLGTTRRVSVSSSEAQASGPAGPASTPDSFDALISHDGRFVTFVSGARNLVRRDTNGEQDIFVRDRLKGATRRVSVNSAEKQSNSSSMGPAISAGGRFVAFMSTATNLTRGDTNEAFDTFVRDRRVGITRRVSIGINDLPPSSPDINEWTSISRDGRFVAFTTAAALVADDTNGRQDVYVRDRTARTTTRVSIRSTGEQVLVPSYFPSLSADGLFVAYQTTGSLVPDDTNNMFDVFVYGPIG